MSDSNKQNESEQLQIELEKELENFNQLEQEKSQIDKSNRELLERKQDELDLSEVKIKSLIEQVEKKQQDCNFSENKWLTEDQNKQTPNNQLYNNQQRQQDYFAKSDTSQMIIENENNFLHNYLYNFKDDTEINSQESSFIQRNYDQAIQNHTSILETETKGMNDQEVLNLIESKKSDLVKKWDENDSLIIKFQNLSIGNQQNDQSKQIKDIKDKNNDIICQLDALDIKYSSIISKSSNKNFDSSQLKQESQSFYNQNINSKRSISQLENDNIMQDENKITIIYKQNPETSAQIQRDLQNKQETIQSGSQNTQRVILDRNPSSNNIIIYATKQQHLGKGFTEDIYHNNIGLSYKYSCLKYNLKDKNIIKNILNNNFYYDSQIKKIEQFAYLFLAAQLDDKHYQVQCLSFNVMNYFAKFAQVLKDYLNLRNMSINQIEIINTSDNINSLFVRSSNANEILITELYLRHGQVDYKLLVDYQGFYLGQIIKQQSLQEGLFPQKKVRLCMLPLRNIEYINFCEFDEKDIRDLQKNQTKDPIFRKSMKKWFEYEVKNQLLPINYTTSEYKGQQLSLEKFVDSITEECNLQLIQKYLVLDNSENLLISIDCKDLEAKKKGVENFKKFYYIHILLCFKLKVINLPQYAQQIVNPLLDQLNNLYNGQAVTQQRRNPYQQQMYPNQFYQNQYPYKKFQTNNTYSNNNNHQNNYYYNNNNNPNNYNRYQPYYQRNNNFQNYNRNQYQEDFYN
ncbi:hypothetical protein ABPG73_010876 [Tetrahymena malaccensis]